MKNLIFVISLLLLCNCAGNPARYASAFLGGFSKGYDRASYNGNQCISEVEGNTVYTRCKR